VENTGVVKTGKFEDLANTWPFGESHGGRRKVSGYGGEMGGGGLGGGGGGLFQEEKRNLLVDGWRAKKKSEEIWTSSDGSKAGKKV